MRKPNKLAVILASDNKLLEESTDPLTFIWRFTLNALGINRNKWNVLMTQYVNEHADGQERQSRMELRSRLTKKLIDNRMSYKTFESGMRMLNAVSLDYKLIMSKDNVYTNVGAHVVLKGGDDVDEVFEDDFPWDEDDDIDTMDLEAVPLPDLDRSPDGKVPIRDLLADPLAYVPISDNCYASMWRQLLSKLKFNLSEWSRAESILLKKYKTYNVKVDVDQTVDTKKIRGEINNLRNSLLKNRISTRYFIHGIRFVRADTAKLSVNVQFNNEVSMQVPYPKDLSRPW